MAQWLSWLERRPVTAEVTGSSPVWVVGSTNKRSLIRCFCFQNLGSQLSWESICLTSRGSQVRALQAPFHLFTLLFICAVVAELADARDLKSRGQKYPYRFDPGLRQNEKPLIFKGFFHVRNFLYTSRTSRNHLHIRSKPILTADLTAGLTAEASKYSSGKLENRPYNWLENWKFPGFPDLSNFILSDQEFY